MRSALLAFALCAGSAAAQEEDSAPAPDAAARLQQDAIAASVWSGILTDIVNPPY